MCQARLSEEVRAKVDRPALNSVWVEAALGIVSRIGCCTATTRLRWYCSFGAGAAAIAPSLRRSGVTTGAFQWASRLRAWCQVVIAQRESLGSEKSHNEIWGSAG
jgi:hypothetical protein